MRQSTELRAPRPVRPAAAALGKMLSRAWSLPPQRNFIQDPSALVLSQVTGKGAVNG